MLTGSLLGYHCGGDRVGAALHGTGQAAAADDGVKLQGHTARRQLLEHQLPPEVKLVHDGGKLAQLVQVVRDIGDKQRLPVVKDSNLCRCRPRVYDKHARHRLRYLDSAESPREGSTTGTSVPCSTPAVRAWQKRVMVL